jgi:hypothetical protein
MASAANPNSNINPNQYSNQNSNLNPNQSCAIEGYCKSYSGNQTFYDKMVKIVTKKASWMIKKQINAAKKGQNPNEITPFAKRNTGLKQVLTYLAQRRYMINVIGTYLSYLEEDPEIDFKLDNEIINKIKNDGNPNEIPLSIELSDTTFIDHKKRYGMTCYLNMYNNKLGICPLKKNLELTEEEKDAELLNNNAILFDKGFKIFDKLTYNYYCKDEKDFNKQEIEEITNIYELYAYVYVYMLTKKKRLFNLDFFKRRVRNHYTLKNPGNTLQMYIDNFKTSIRYEDILLYYRNVVVPFGITRNSMISDYGLPYNFITGKVGDGSTNNEDIQPCVCKISVNTPIYYDINNIEELKNLGKCMSQRAYYFKMKNIKNKVYRDNKEDIPIVTYQKISKNGTQFDLSLTKLVYIKYIDEGEDINIESHMISHTDENNLEDVVNIIEGIYNNIISNKQVKPNIARIYWWLSQGTLYSRGSAAITEYLNKALRSAFKLPNGKMKNIEYKIPRTYNKWINDMKLKYDDLQCQSNTKLDWKFPFKEIPRREVSNQNYISRTKRWKLKYPIFPDLEAILYEDLIESPLDIDIRTVNQSRKKNHQQDKEIFIQQDIEKFVKKIYPTLWDYPRK